MFEIIAFTVIGILLAVLFVFVRLQRISRVIRKVLTGAKDEQTLPHTQEWELYHGSSAQSQGVRVALSELNIPYKSYFISVESNPYAIIQPSVMKNLPSVQIPILLHNGRTVLGSGKQFKYLIDRQITHGRMIPPSLAEKSRLEDWLGRAPAVEKNQFRMTPGNEIFTISLPIWAALVEHTSYQTMVKIFLQNRFSRLTINTRAIRLLKLTSLLENTELMDAFETAKETVERHLDDIENWLTVYEGPWITGETFTQLDIDAMVLLDRLHLITMLEDLLNARRPALREYWARLSSRQSYQTAIVSHRRLDVIEARLRILKTRESNKEFDELLKVNH